MTRKHKSASAKSGKAAKAAPLAAAPQSNAPTTATAAPELARIYHLSSFVVFSLPPELRTILGEEGYARCVKDLEDRELTFLIRIDSDVIYLNSEIVLMPSKRLAAAAT